MNNTELIAEAKQKPSLLGDATVAKLIRALEDAEKRLVDAWGEGYIYGYPVGFEEAGGGEIEHAAPNPYRVQS